MQVELKQRGRASIDFVAALSGTLRASRANLTSEITLAGVRNESLPADFDERMAVFESAIAAAPTHSRYAALRDWLGHHHGLIAMHATLQQHSHEVFLQPRLAGDESLGQPRMLAFVRCGVPSSLPCSPKFQAAVGGPRRTNGGVRSGATGRGGGPGRGVTGGVCRSTPA